ncbi:hypothetical protein [uncultured Xanthomonas sp.]|nr:hypothetical protein [uncultured Xanthomonas sp.]
MPARTVAQIVQRAAQLQRTVVAQNSRLRQRDGSSAGGGADARGFTVAGMSVRPPCR